MVLRRLTLEDMDEAARVHRASFNECLPWLTGLHTPDEDRWFFRERVFPSCELWGDERDGRLAGIIAFRDGWIDHLYVLPGFQRRGVGSGLLALALARLTSIELWAFQRNARARAFYEKHGFVVVDMTDGLRNDEKEPDVRYRWAGGRASER